MSFLDIFKRKEEYELDELPKWLTEKWKPRKNKYQNQITELKKEIQKLKEKAHHSVQILENAELENPDIHDRSKQIMEGNREAYIKKVRQFLDSGLENYDSHVERFGEGSAKSFYVLRQFFSNQVSEIASHINKIDETVTEIRKVEEQKEQEFEKLMDILEMIKSIKTHQSQKQTAEEREESLKQELETIENQKKTVQKQIELLKQSKKYKEYQDLKIERENAQNRIESIENDIHKKFSVLERALKKHQRQSMRPKLIQKYLDSPVKALAQDSELEIIDELKKINLDQLDLKDHKREISREEIQNIKLGEKRDTLKQIKERQYDLKRLINTNSAFLKLKDLEYRQEYLDEREEKMQKQLDELEVKEIDKRQIKNQIQREIKELFNIKVVIP